MASRKIQANAQKKFTQEITVIFDDGLDIIEEALPSTLPPEIDWVSNFKVVKRPGKGLTSRRYKIQLQKKTGSLVASYDGVTYVPITTRTLRPGWVEADLEEDDPAIGWTR